MHFNYRFTAFLHGHILLDRAKLGWTSPKHLHAKEIEEAPPL
jgi:hypothetical protein